LFIEVDDCCSLSKILALTLTLSLMDPCNPCGGVVLACSPKGASTGPDSNRDWNCCSGDREGVWWYCERVVAGESCVGGRSVMGEGSTGAWRLRRRELS